MSQTVDKPSRYCWVVLGLGWLVMVTTWWSWTVIPSLAFQLVPDLALTQVKYSLIYTAPLMVAAVTALPGGALADRYGIRTIVAVAAFAAAVTGFSRAYVSSFEGLFFIQCFRGIAWGMTLTNLPKLVGIWFPPRRIGLASGIYMTGMGTGSALGLFTGPLFGTWQHAFLVTGIISLAVAILWAAFARSCPAGVDIPRPDILTGLKAGLKSRDIWLVGISLFLFQGALMSFQANLAKALTGIHNIAPADAGGFSAFLTFGLAVGNLTMPLASDRLGLRRPFLFAGASIGILLLFLSWVLAPGVVIWLTAFTGGVIVGGVLPVFLAIPAELPGIGKGFIGGAAGLAIALGNAGGFLVSVFVIAPVMASGTAAAYNQGFLAIMAIVAAVTLPLIFLRETGQRAKEGVKIPKKFQ